MATKYVRINPRSQLTTRHRAGMGFSQTWKPIEVDAATLAAIEEDPYLEVSETPTVLVEVAAATQAGAIDPYPDSFNPVISESGQDPNNTPESTATDEGSTGEKAAEGTDTGTASPVANEALAVTGNENLTERGPEPETAEGLATGGEINTGESAPAVAAADAGADGTAATDGEQPANTAEKTAAELRDDAIKSGIAKLDPNNPEHWLKDGRPSTIALRDVAGVVIMSTERDAIWDEIQAARSAG